MPPVATVPEEIIVEEDPVEMILEQEAPMVHEVILADAEPEMSQPCLYYTLMRDYEESPSRMVDDLDDLTKANSDMDECFLEMEAIIGIESSSLNLKFRVKNKSLGIV
jgi:hypothetical protein